MSTPEPTPPASAVSFLGPAQRKVLAAALTLAGAAAILAFVVAAIGQLGRLVSMFSPVLWPLAVAGILAMLLQPVVGAVERWLRLRRLLAVALLYALALLAIASLFVVLAPILFEQLMELLRKVPALWAEATAFFQVRFPRWLELINTYFPGAAASGSIPDFSKVVSEQLAAAWPTIGNFGGQLLGLFSRVAGLAVIPVYLFFFLQADDDPAGRLGRHLVFLKPETREDAVFLMREFISIVTAFFRGQLLIGLIMAAMLSTGFSVVGLRFGLLIGLCMGLLNIVPYLGSVIGLSVALPLAFFQEGGGWHTLGLVLAVFAVTQATEGWFLTPRIMGRQTGLHPLAIIIAIFFWGIALNGILGMVLAIPLTAFFVTAWRLAKRNYIRPIA